MKRYARIIVAVTFLLGLSVAAKAEGGDEVVVTLPFEFVVRGTTLPAGTYTVSRFSEQPFGALKLTSKDKGSTVFVEPNDMEAASDYNPKLRFQKIGEQHFLSAIQTPDYIYNFYISRSVTLEAAAKQRAPVSASASGGGE